jgi:triacylglycerol esterase/lipase EstA (alpha/beta hydrolase family)
VLGALSPARRRLYLVLGLGAVVAAVAVAAPLALTRDPDVAPVAQDEPGPVVLVPGYGGSTTPLEPLAAALTNVGRDVTMMALVGDGKGDLADQAEALDETVAAALATSTARSVDVVGYSAGGLVARLWVRDFGGGQLARRVVMLATPNHGTDLAGLAGDFTSSGCPMACQQMVPDSDFLRALNAGDETPNGPLWVSVWTEADDVVRPPTSASLEGAVDFSIQSVCSDLALDHGQLPVDPRVITMTMSELTTQPPGVPDPAACVSS